MSIVDPLGSAADQLARTRLDDAARARLVRSIRHRRAPADPRRNAAAMLRDLADKIEPEQPCMDC
ncbi:MAG: hypothetical protein QOG16_1423 [Actinomycetota bacterium]|jgi:hypothetical protein|nr:hypothetical protein [Actinomycetota bacterium]